MANIQDYIQQIVGASTATMNIPANAKDQVLRVYFYETGGQRELVLTIDARDINKAKTVLIQRAVFVKANTFGIVLLSM